MLGDEAVIAINGNSSEEDKELFQLYNTGYSHLILSVLSSKDIRAVDRASTEALPRGCLMTAWKNVNNNYKRKTVGAKDKLLTKFSKTRLDKMTMDPETWIIGLQGIQDDLDHFHEHKLMDDELTLHAIMILTSQYDA